MTPVNPLLAMSRAMEPNVLIFDIETTPMLSWHWRCYDENISPAQVVKESTVLCYAAKWLHSPLVAFGRKTGRSDRRVCKDLWTLFDRADIVVAHNGRAFDTKVMNSRWLLHGVQPPSPYKCVDTLRLAKAVGRFGINKLDYLGRYLKLGKKVEHEGFDMWLKCMRGDADAWARMEAYNIQDTLLLEELYLKLRPWDKRHPNVGLMHADTGVLRCVSCGAAAVEPLKAGTAYTAAGVYPAFRCGACGKVMRSRTRDKRGDYGVANTL